MEANPRTLLKVFQPDIQYVVPIFQRQYVWNEEDQWAELWEDLLETIDDVDRVQTLKEQGADLPLPSHFLGAIVCDQSVSVGSDIDERPLIDGQQRLTTLQILLASAHRLAEARSAEQASGLLAKLIKNDENLAEEPNDRYKVWPSDPDRVAFELAMNGTEADTTLADNQIVKAGIFFSAQLSGWLGNSDPDTELTRLARVLRRHIELVVIDLQPGDNAQVIFESLNYGGRELTAIDLTKNHVFFKAEKLDLDLRQIHSEYWAPFDETWWRETITQGRLKRARAELLLMHWLKLELLEEVRAHRLFVEFRDLPALKADLQGTVIRLAQDRDLYRRCDEESGPLPAEVGGFFQRLNRLNQSTPRPVTLQLLRAVPDVLDPDRASRAFHALDSYLWRRALTRGSTANYNRVMLEALRAIDEDLEHADEKLITYLAGLEGASVSWPRDSELRTDLDGRWLYGQGRVSWEVIRTALRAVENRWRAPMGEDPLGPDADLQIEHMLPQSWGEYWPVAPEPAESLADREQDRNNHVHRLGNLTLVSPSMNKSLSHREWSVKRQQLNLHSNALVTRRYVELEIWNEAEIQKRGKALIDELIAVWPDPTNEFLRPSAD